MSNLFIFLILLLWSGKLCTLHEPKTQYSQEMILEMHANKDGILNTTKTIAMRFSPYQMISKIRSRRSSNVDRIGEFCSSEMKRAPSLTMDLCRLLVSLGSLKLPAEDLFKDCTRLPAISAPKIEVEKSLEATIDDGNEQLILNENKNVILVLGNTGAGKTTMTQLIAGDPTKLHSVLTKSNQTVIIDDDNRIGLPTIKSKTLIPELVTDINNEVAFYDCPGFSDSRGPVSDIAANYFVKKITDHVEKIKLLFIVIHSSLKIGNDRLDFERLVNHAIKFVKNIDKYKNSIGLIVTKVRSYSEQGTYLSDEEIMGQIVEFLQNYIVTKREESQNLGISPEIKSSIENKIKFVQSLLTQDENLRFGKIGFFRTPEKCGSLATIQSSMSSRSQLINLHKSLVFSQKNENDFGYTLKAETVIQVISFAKQINSRIQNYTRKVVSQVEKTRDETLENIKDLHLVVSKLDSEYQMFKNLEQQLGIETSLTNAVTTAAKKLDSIGYTVHPSFISQVRKREDMLDFFQDTTEFPIEKETVQLSYIISQFTKKLENLTDSYSLLTESKTELAKYTFHKTQPLNPKISNAIEGLRFLKQFKIVSIKPHQEELFLHQPDKLRERWLVDIINVALERPKLEITNGEMKVTGRYVKLSDLIENRAPKNCRHCKVIEIYATDTIFIDSDINAVGKEIQLSIVAPRWEVIGRNVFNLNGSNGEAYGKAENGKQRGDNGLAGNPGKAGGNAGHFFGLGSTFVDSELLTIFSNGGIGGNGQEGGDGAEGIDGEHMVYEKFPSCASLDKGYDEREDGVYAVVYREVWYTYYGKHGTPGGAGGAGGVGGIGGYPGSVKIISTSTTLKANMEINTGRNGAGGRGGTGGTGGKTGDGMKCAYWGSLGCGWRGCTTVRVTSRSSNGANGDENKNQHKQEQPRNPVFKMVYSKIVNAWKSLFLQKDQPSASCEFLNQLDGSSDIIQMYNTIGYSEELLSLLKSFSTSKSQFDFMSLFQSFLTRIEMYSKNPKLSENNLEYKKVWNYLYATTLGKLTALNRVKGSRSVTNTLGYFDIVSKSIERIKEVQTAAVMQEHKKEYESEINGKIEEAMNFINSQILPSIDEIEKELDAQIAGLLENINKLNTEERENLSQLEVEKRKFESAMVLRGIFSAVKAVGQVTSFLGPVGATIGGVVNTAASITEPFVLDDNSKIRTQNNLPSSVKNQAINIDSQLRADKEKQVKIFTAQISEVKKAISGNTEVLGSLSAEIKRAEAAIEIFKNDGTLDSGSYLTALNKLQNDKSSLQVALTNKELELNSKNEINTQLESDKKKFEERNAKATKALQFTQNVVRSAEVCFEIYNKHKNDVAKLDEFGKAIRAAEENVKKLTSYKNDIYDTLIPLTQELTSTMSNVAGKLEGKSSIALEVSKWDVKTKLKEMKMKINAFTQGQKLQENFLHCIEKIEEAMTVLIDLFDHIQEHENRKKLADFISNINSASAREIPITNSALISIVNKLNLIVQSDLFAAQYVIALHSFKQWVFPFANLYLAEKTTLGLEHQTFERAADFYKEKVIHMKSTLDLYKTNTFGDHDTHLFESPFSSSLRSSQPFFVWKNDKWRNSIRHILAGNSVQMKADVVKSPEGKEAIKFRLIEINFKSTVQSVQEKIDDTLKDFRVTLTHDGISYYRFLNQYFVMHGDNQTISYNFEKSGDERTGANLVYKKFKNGDCLLSPYTLWTIQLSKANPSGSFSELEQLKNSVDMELVGYGTYVDKSVQTNLKLNIRDFYEMDNTIRDEF